MSWFRFPLHLLLITLLLSGASLPAMSVAKDSSAHRYFIALPLRFTHIQDHNTLLSGIKLGRRMGDGFHLSLTVYHSFYLKSFHPAAGLSAFGTEQPRFFIYSAGLEADYRLFRYQRFSGWAQLYAGWGFMKYNLDAHNFNSKSLHYPALEPVLKLEYQTKPLNSIGLGLGYRPFFNNKAIPYQSTIGNGEIPLQTKWPNGLLALLELRWFF